MKLKKVYSMAFRFTNLFINHNDGQRVAKTNYNFLLEGNLKDYTFRYIYFNGEYEQETFDILDLIVKKDQTWLDLGSNIGYFSLYFATKAKQVTSVDANPTLTKMVSDQSSVNSYSNVESLNYAISNESGKEVEFFITPDDNARSSLIKHNDMSEVIKISAETISIDKLSHQFSIKPFGIKVDIEGIEILALKGAHELLTNTPPKVILMELSQREECMASPNELIEYLKPYKYSAYIIRNNKLTLKTEDMSLSEELDPNGYFIHDSYLSEIQEIID
jgi:FkbM family methyltransferase